MVFLGNLKQNFCQAQFEDKVDSQPKIIVHQQLIFPYGSWFYHFKNIFCIFRPFFKNFEQLVKTLSKHYSICHFVNRNQKKSSKYAEQKAEMAFNVMDR